MLWFLNGVAESLDNPFRKDASTLELAEVQKKLNLQVCSLIRQAKSPTPCLRPDWHKADRRLNAKTDSMDDVVRQYHSSRSSEACSSREVAGSGSGLTQSRSDA